MVPEIGDSNAAARDDGVDLVQFQRRWPAHLPTHDCAAVAGGGLLEGLVQAGRHRRRR